jgi:hypothetical protein
LAQTETTAEENAILVALDGSGFLEGVTVKA